MDLIFPAEFTTERTASQTRRVAGAPEYVLKDTTYRVTLKERALGLHRADVLLRGADGRNREYPDRLAATALSFVDSPARDPVESACSGDPALSGRECGTLAGAIGTKGCQGRSQLTARVVVTPGDDAPEMIDGFVEVETTGKGRARLRIPVVRYARQGKGIEILSHASILDRRIGAIQLSHASEEPAVMSRESQRQSIYRKIGNDWPVVCLIVLAALFAVLAYEVIVSYAVMADECADLPAGVSYWDLGRFYIYRENPPLVQALAALPVWLSGRKWIIRGLARGGGASGTSGRISCERIPRTTIATW